MVLRACTPLGDLQYVYTLVLGSAGVHPVLTVTYTMYLCSLTHPNIKGKTLSTFPITIAAIQSVDKGDHFVVSTI